MSNGGSSRVLIPNNIRKMIHDIKEIASKHSDDDIHAMLKECNMDPNETVQRLLYLDTFQEVKKKRDIRKANVSSRVSEESRWRTGTQGRGFRGGRGHYSSSYNYHGGGGGGRNVNVPKENGVNNCMESGFSTLPAVPEKIEKNMKSCVPISSNISVNGPTSIPNGSSDLERAPKLSSDTAVMPPLNSQNPGVVASKDESSSHMNASKSVATFPAVNGSVATCTIANSIQATLGDVSSALLKESLSVGKNQLLERSQPSQLIGLSEVVASEGATLALDGGHEPLSEQNMSVLQDAISKLDTKLEINISSHQVVIFPVHFQVPEDIKNGLTFGSLDLEQSVNLDNDPDDSNVSLPDPELLQEADEAAKETSFSNLNVSSTAQEGDYLDNPHSPPHVPDSKAHLEDNVSLVAALKYDHSKKDIMFSQGGPQYPFFHMGPNYGFRFIHPMLGSQHVKCEGTGPQSGNSTASSPSATTQSASVGQSSISISPPPFPVFRHPYPPYYYPFAPHFPSFYLAPNGQQLIGPSGLPSLTSTGKVFLSPPAAVQGTKFSFPQGKPGINSGHLTQFGVPSGYSSYSPSPAVTSENSAGNEKIAASGLKENDAYSVVQQGEGLPRLWLPAPDRDILHSNSFYNHLPHGQHVAFPPPPPAGLYHTTKTTMTATSTAHPFL